MDALLELEGITRHFGSVVALSRASIAVRRGTVHALLGENGAGKTTLMRIAYGLAAPDAGIVRVAGQVHRPATPADAMRAGVAMVQQHCALVPVMTVADNIALGLPRRVRVSAASIAAAARQAGLPIEPDALVEALTVAAQQRVEIVKALVRDARLLILDEPTAALAPAEAEELLAWVRRFADRGGGVVLITHRIAEAMAHADEVTVLRRGATALSGPRPALNREALIAAMLGPQAGEATAVHEGRREHAGTGVIASSSSLAVADERGTTRLRDGTMLVRRGEVVGVAGVEGSGCRELLRALAGRARPSRGHVTLPGSVGFIPEDRHREAVVLDAPVSDNLALHGAGRRRGLLLQTRLRAEAEALVRAYRIAAPDVRAPAWTLSGGNQQRLVIARELAADPALLIVENPTRGLDVLAAAEVRHRIREAAGRGAGVVYHSPDLDELLEVSDRILVVHAGTVREVRRDRDAVGRAMLGAA